MIIISSEFGLKTDLVDRYPEFGVESSRVPRVCIKGDL